MWEKKNKFPGGSQKVFVKPFNSNTLLVQPVWKFPIAWSEKTQSSNCCALQIFQNSFSFNLVKNWVFFLNCFVKPIWKYIVPWKVDKQWHKLWYRPWKVYRQKYRLFYRSWNVSTETKPIRLLVVCFSRLQCSVQYKVRNTILTLNLSHSTDDMKCCSNSIYTRFYPTKKYGYAGLFSSCSLS